MHSFDAAENGLIEVVRESLHKKLYDIDYRNEEGLTALMLALANGHKDVVDALLIRKSSRTIFHSPKANKVGGANEKKGRIVSGKKNFQQRSKNGCSCETI